MIDIKFLRENPDIVKENIKKKFQDKKLPLVDEVIELDAKSRAAKQEADDLRAKRNQLSKQIGALMKEGKKEEAEAVKAQVAEFAERLAELEEQEKTYSEQVTKDMQHYAEEVARVIGLDTYSRSDFLLNDKNEMFCLEANTLPGMTPTSLLPQEAAVIGMSFNQLCEHLIDISLKKYEV